MPWCVFYKVLCHPGTASFVTMFFEYNSNLSLAKGEVTRLRRAGPPCAGRFEGLRIINFFNAPAPVFHHCT
ncbi:MAG: hypothetical protein ABIL68_04800, partial [bacterium]